MTNQQLLRIAAYLIIAMAVVAMLVYGKPFFVPVCFAGLLAMLLLPEAKWLQHKGIGKVPAVLLSILTLIAGAGVILFLIGWQLHNLTAQAHNIEQQLSEKLSGAQQFIANELNIPKEEQIALIKKQQASAGGKLSAIITGFLSGIGGLFTNILLVLVYTFLFLFLRDRLKNFLLRLFPPDKRSSTSAVITKVQEVSHKYLISLGLMIVALWVMYGIGFSIIGVKQPLFFALLCGTLELVPFVGNLTGTALTVIFSFAQGGDMQLILLIILTYAIVQFIQSYFLEPLLVGKGVNINPLFTIAGIVAGELIWGIPGMILAIPLLGVARIVCEHVEPLHPYAYLLGNNDTTKQPRTKKTRR